MTHTLTAAATVAFEELPYTLEQVQTNVAAIAALFELDEKSPLVFTFHAHEDGDVPNSFKFSFKTDEGENLPSGYPFQFDFVVRSGNGVFAVDVDEHQVEIDGYLETNEPIRTTGVAYHETNVLTPYEIVKKLVESVADLLSVEARERLGNSPQLQASDNPLAPLMRDIFPPVPVGIMQLTEAFIRLDAILKNHTDGLLEAGIRYIYSGFHEFWVGYNFKKLKEADANALYAEHDRKGWSVAGPISIKDPTYGVDESLYHFDENDYKNDAAEPHNTESVGWLSLTAADIFGKAAEWVSTALQAGLPDEAELEILAIMETFPPNPSTDQPVVAAAPAPA